MEQRLSREANSHSSSQEIPCPLWNPKVNYRVDENPPLKPILSWTNSVYNFPSYFPKIQSNIIFSSTPRASNWYLPFRSYKHNFLCFL